ncbi:MAG TPA: hypothetical protein VJ732_20375 [Bryobacteraceae bacterium]|nr:hypothetical protein [Bryobacteraceae bacterium]
MPTELEDRCNAIEECYEFMLAYAAQGLPSDAGTATGGQLREFLQRASAAVSGLAAAYRTAIEEGGLQPAAPYQAFLKVLDRDATDALAAMELVLAQAAISSQLIDNLNASMHLRALLTDLFLIDEVLKLHHVSAATS